jgi:hypothetical protein
MAFDKVGLIAVLSNQTIGISLRFSGHGVPGPDRGAQWIMADATSDNSRLQVSNFRKVKIITQPGNPDEMPSGQLSVTYECDVTNLGLNEVFSVQGGGNV